MSIEVSGIMKCANVTEHYIRSRLGLAPDVPVMKIYEDDVDHSSYNLVPCILDGDVRRWELASGHSYLVLCGDEIFHKTLGAESSTKISKGKDLEVSILSSSDDDVVTEVDHPREVLEPKLPNADTMENTSAQLLIRISALDSLLAICGSSELAKFVRSFTFKFEQVQSLPHTYNGDFVFEFPPVDASRERGFGLRDMDRSNDCYNWTRIMNTSANLLPKKRYKVSKSCCVGQLEC
jgi:hypothetical protein